MSSSVDELVSALASGDSDTVNDLIDRLSSLDVEAQAEHFEAWFSESVDLFDRSGNGYVRQAVVRAVQELMPGMVAAYKAIDDGVQTDLTVDGGKDRLEMGCKFLLRAIQDEDGRVRRSAQRALKDGFRAYDTLEDNERLSSIRDELQRIASEVDSERRSDIDEAISDVEFFLRSDEARFIGALSRLAKQVDER